MPNVQEVIPEKRIEGWIITIEKIMEIERLEGLMQEAAEKQKEIMIKITKLDFEK